VAGGQTSHRLAQGACAGGASAPLVHNLTLSAVAERLHFLPCLAPIRVRCRNVEELDLIVALRNWWLQPSRSDQARTIGGGHGDQKIWKTGGPPLGPSPNSPRCSTLSGALPVFLTASGMCDSRSSHSITRSARSSTDGGMVSPSVLAVFMLITSSNFVGCSTGRSAGLAPLRILSTSRAAWRPSCSSAAA
jgi:hypothetical protein